MALVPATVRSQGVLHVHRPSLFHARADHGRGFHPLVENGQPAAIVNDPGTSLEDKRAAMGDLIRLRRSLEHTNIANMDRAAIIETDSWKDIEGLFAE